MRTTALFAAVAVLGFVAGARAESDADPRADSQAEGDAEVRPDSQMPQIEPGARAVSSDEGCLREPVVMRRSGVALPATLSLIDCAGRPDPSALASLSQLAAPGTGAGSEDALETSQRATRQVNPELLSRLQRIADHFPGRTFEVVSGYRPGARPGSRHRSADALDLRIEGVDNAELSEFARSLEATGVGYYPNSTFVHVDVRPNAFYWVDRSAPGEPPDYERANESAADAKQSAEATPSEVETATDSGSFAVATSAAADLDGPSDAELEADLKSLAERALLVMNEALGRTTSFDSSLPARGQI